MSILPVIEIKPNTKRCKDKIGRFGKVYQVLQGPKSITAIPGKPCVLLRPTRVPEENVLDHFWIEQEHCVPMFSDTIHYGPEWRK